MPKFIANVEIHATVPVTFEAENLERAREIAEDITPVEYLDEIEFHLTQEVGDVLPIEEADRMGLVDGKAPDKA